MTRFLRSVLWTALVVVVLFHVVGGWYFAGVLEEDGLVVDHSPPELDLLVAAVDQTSVTLRPLIGEAPALDDPGLFGLEWAEGYARLGEVTATDSDGSVTRRVLSSSPLPDRGATVRLDSFVYDGDPETALSLPFSDVEFTTSFGVFPAWRLGGRNPTWVIHVHGKGASREEALRSLEAIALAGHPQLVITYRNDQGVADDPSGYYRYGVTEWEEVEAAVAYAMAEGAGGVVLYGYSAGGAHILSYLYRRPDNPVVGVVLDSPSADFGTTVDYGVSQRTVPFLGITVPPTLTWVAKQLAALRFDLDWGQLDYVASADLLTVPVLVFHGTDDLTVPIEESLRLAAARPDLVRLRQVKNAGHVRSWNVDPRAYEADLEEFLAQVSG